ncbi:MULTISPECIES: TetR/AcrR family transcriptional regulator [unclassified Pseudonocardia]|uniref:TetR/AcrR family transcriptional regulator n=1 Tax=unclassified Pseudonocardia TaxID=2619320 RepID=UPI0001FFEB09|nr:MULTISPECIES: TetR/AcrR family transcriptional regulator [unclassified Pseudonocardia]ALE73326.1 TetR family transcriptional regulator [Pseudonocardia sp. EC080625-04]ALL76663.1 TetR family transcriptional regulator [Pseudonocardia sp. EC080610-09]ALL83691.1 TetR family transcriptional regulator [Pseudonocardia sp. EC080619-01]OLM18959.1 putative transcriptional regulator, TetR family [Pseudonocardia sp. Ae707_Ps1]
MARANPIDKHDARRRALADSALRTLGELGFARSSLREIANNSPFSHGVVHYYFGDKLDLIVYCVRQYKAVCVTRYDGAVAGSTTADGLVAAFADTLRQTIVDEAPMHRLWYDLRSQSMFEEGLREAVQQIDRTLEDMVWRVVTRYAELAGSGTALTPHTAYGMFDGVFQQAVLGYLAGHEQEALDVLRAEVHDLMPLTLRAPRADAA